MPLRDHFRPPTSQTASWEAVHGGWPMVIVQSLARKLPPQYVAHPHVHLEAYEVRVYDTERNQRLVAAVELVSQPTRIGPNIAQHLSPSA